MIRMKEHTERMVKGWAESRKVSEEIMIEKIVNWALHHAPKNLDEIDEYGLPYVSKEEEEDLNRSFNKDYSKEETYSMEEVDAILQK